MSKVAKNVAKSVGDAYRYIYRNKACSRQMLIDDLKISRPTIAKYLNELRESNLICNAGEMESTGGRKAESLEIVPGARYAMGIDITARHLTLVIVDLRLNILENNRIRVLYEDTDEYYQMVGREVKDMLARQNIAADHFLGIGVSLPAIIDEDMKTIHYMNVLNSSDLFFERLQSYIEYPLLLFNDANSAGWTELWKREHKKPMVYLSLSSTVGGAIITKKLYTGLNSRGGEFGHMTIVPNGKKCYCGQRGCLNAYCSATNFMDFTDGDLKKFFHLLKETNNPGMQRVLQEYLEYLAIGVNNLRMAFDCDVVLGGTVGPFLADYLDEFREIVRQRTPYIDNGDYVKISSVQTASSAVGAALYYINHFIQTF